MVFRRGRIVANLNVNETDGQDVVSYITGAKLGGPEAATSTQDRLEGFLSEVAAHKAKVHVSYSFASAYSYDAGRIEMNRLLRSKPAEAYFCGDDVLSIGALSAVQKHGLHVPNDIGLIE